jgi:hypothetical protein
MECRTLILTCLINRFTVHIQNVLKKSFQNWQLLLLTYNSSCMWWHAHFLHVTMAHSPVMQTGQYWTQFAVVRHQHVHWLITWVSTVEVQTEKHWKLSTEFPELQINGGWLWSLLNYRFIHNATRESQEPCTWQIWVYPSLFHVMHMWL